MMFEEELVASHGPYVAYYSDQNEECSIINSNGTLEGIKRPDWMRAMGPKFMNAKVGEVVWPGTHNSGSYCSEFDFGKVVNDDRLQYIGTHLLNYLGRGLKRFASGWSQTQSMNVRQQLDQGVRYIDLRISKCLQDNEYYIVHSFCGPPLKEILNDLCAFFSEHQGECLLLEVAPVREVDHVELHDIFESKLGQFLLKKEPGINPIFLTISHLIQKGRIVLLYRSPSDMSLRVPCFWDRGMIRAPFVESLSPSVKENFQLEKFTDFFLNNHQKICNKHKNVFHFMYALTPNLSQILRSAPLCNFFVSLEEQNNLRSLEECAQFLNPGLEKFIKKIEQHTKSHDIGMIISVDYVEKSQLLHQVIALNKSKFL